MSIKKNLILTGSAVLIFFVGIMGGSFFSGQELLMNSHTGRLMNHDSKGEIGNNDEKNSIDSNEEISAKLNSGRKKLLAEGNYRCCLNKPCSYCFKEGECDCLDKIMNGKHPCGECIGEILEGEGNPLLSEYFATAIADELGKKYTPTIKQIIADKYNMPIEKQL